MRVSRLCTTGIIEHIDAPISELRPGDMVVSRVQPFTGLFPASRNDIAVVRNRDDQTLMGYSGIAAWLLSCLRRADVELGTTAGIIGAGVEGMILAQLCRLVGAQASVFDTSDERLRKAAVLNIPVYPLGNGGVLRIKETLAGRLGVDILFVTGMITNQAVWSDIFSLLRPGGRLVILQEQYLQVPDNLMQSQTATIELASSDQSWDDFTDTNKLTHPCGYMRWDTTSNLSLCTELIGQKKLALESIPLNTITVNTPDGACGLVLPRQQGSAVLLSFHNASGDAYAAGQ